MVFPLKHICGEDDRVDLGPHKLSSLFDFIVWSEQVHHSRRNCPARGSRGMLWIVPRGLHLSMKTKPPGRRRSFEQAIH